MPEPATPVLDGTAAVIVVSTSAAAGTATDTTGPVLVDWLNEQGLRTEAPLVVADGPAVTAALRSELARRHRVILTTGGTGISPDDATPEATEPFLQVQLPGLMEELRRRGTAAAPWASLTRGLAGFAGRTFVMNLPGSRGGVADGLAVLEPVLEHLLTQRAGGGQHGPRV